MGTHAHRERRQFVLGPMMCIDWQGYAALVTLHAPETVQKRQCCPDPHRPQEVEGVLDHTVYLHTKVTASAASQKYSKSGPTCNDQWIDHWLQDPATTELAGCPDWVFGLACRPFSWKSK